MIDNKIPDTIALVKKTDYNTYITVINRKRIAHKLRQLSTKLVDDLTKEFGVISAGRLKLINGYSILNVAKWFVDNLSHSYLIFQPIFKTFRMLTNDT